MAAPASTPLTGPVEIVGAGLLGTSVGLALQRVGVDVWLSDRNPDHVRTASGLGAGRAVVPGDRPQLVVVAVPPAELGYAITRALELTEAYGAVVTDVGSVKAGPLAAVAAPGVERYVGGHPMAGSERSGPLAATATLFDGRPWAVTPHPTAGPAAVALVEALATTCGAVPVRLTPEEHDRAVARISHVPHLMAALTASGLLEAPSTHLALSGQGVRDVTRIAAGDPSLYGQIVSANAAEVIALLLRVRDRLDDVIESLDLGDQRGLQTLLADGVAGTAAIPGKHGGPLRPVASVFVAVPDSPGALARLFADVGAEDVNVEDVRIDHDQGRPVGQVELVVDAGSAAALVDGLTGRDWVCHR